LDETKTGSFLQKQHLHTLADDPFPCRYDKSWVRKKKKKESYPVKSTLLFSNPNGTLIHYEREKKIPREETKGRDPFQPNHAKISLPRLRVVNLAL